jgi:hypothetical protein
MSAVEPIRSVNRMVVIAMGELANLCNDLTLATDIPIERFGEVR